MAPCTGIVWKYYQSVLTKSHRISKRIQICITGENCKVRLYSVSVDVKHVFYSLVLCVLLILTVLLLSLPLWVWCMWAFTLQAGAYFCLRCEWYSIWLRNVENRTQTRQLIEADRVISFPWFTLILELIAIPKIIHSIGLV